MTPAASVNPPAQRMPAYFFAHGAGPCFFMDWPYGAPDTWDRLGQWLRSMGPQVQALAGRPAAIVVVSAHWETSPLRVNGLHLNGLLYDYGGFPPHTYALRYPAPGSAPLAGRVAGLLADCGFEVQRDEDRERDRDGQCGDHPAPGDKEAADRRGGEKTDPADHADEPVRLVASVLGHQ